MNRLQGVYVPPLAMMTMTGIERSSGGILAAVDVGVLR